MFKKFLICFLLINIVFTSTNVISAESIDVDSNAYSFLETTNDFINDIEDTILVDELTEVIEEKLEKDVKIKKKQIRKQRRKRMEEEKTKIKENIINSKSKNNKCNIKKKYLKYMGEYSFTAYCPYSCCCDGYGISDSSQTPYTSSGAVAQEGVTIAVDSSVIPYGSIVIIEIDGQQYKYIAQDCGGAIRGNIIDIYFNSHQKAMNFGRKYGKTYILK